MIEFLKSTVELAAVVRLYGDAVGLIIGAVAIIVLAAYVVYTKFKIGE